MGGHRLQQCHHSGDVLGVGVKRSNHRDARVLETSQMHNACNLVVGEDLFEELAFQDAALVERAVLVNEAAMPGGQVVDHYRRHVVVEESPHYVGADISGATGYQPRHGVSTFPRSVSVAVGGPSGQ